MGTKRNRKQYSGDIHSDITDEPEILDVANKLYIPSPKIKKTKRTRDIMLIPMRIKTPFRYPGGKFYALNLLRPFYENLCFDEYREPFVGGGSVFWDIPLPKSSWINDVDSELISVYKCMKSSTKRSELIQMLSTEIASKERWREVFEFEPKNEIEVAYKYYYLNRTSFSGKLISPAWGYRPKRSLPPERWHERIDPCGIKLRNTKITSLDFESCIIQPAKGDSCLLFVDPPYFNPKKKKHYRNGFDLDDHHRLADVLKKSKHKFFLTYDNVDGVKDLYKWAHVHEVSFFYRVANSTDFMGKRNLGCELVISNYMPPEFN